MANRSTHRDCIILKNKKSYKITIKLNSELDIKVKY